MFTFELEDTNNNWKEFVVQFSFPSKKRKDKNRKIVTCKIYDKESNLLVSIGHATKNEKDHYIKYEGRKWALTHAIKDFTKAQRTSIWKQFFKTFPRTVYVTKKVKVNG